MKKLLMTLLLVLTVMGLTACAEPIRPQIPNSVDENFLNQAMVVFEEIDDDTMELDPEGTDADDHANVNQIYVMADGEREIAFSEALDKMVQLQPSVISGDREALKQYLAVRTEAMNALNFGDNGEPDKFQVYPFIFGEEE